MKDKDYQNSITTTLSPQEVLERISHVSLWWAKNVEGKSTEADDVFTVRFKNGDTYTMKVVEIVQNKKIIWDVIDSYQGWNEQHAEWNGTKIIWDIFPQKNKIVVQMTHVGLVPQFECFNACSQGWDYLLQRSLQKLLNDNEGMPV
jgi:hypothetical protein